MYCQTRYDPGLLSSSDCPQVRRIQASFLSGTSWNPDHRLAAAEQDAEPPHSIREWNPPISVRPSSRIAVIASNVFKINPPGHWDEQKKPVLLSSRIRSGPAAYRCCPAQKAHRPAEV